MGSLFAAFILSFTVAVVVAFGIAVAYGLISGILIIFRQRSRPASPSAPALVPSHTQAGGD